MPAGSIKGTTGLYEYRTKAGQPTKLVVAIKIGLHYV